jgi:hypothetical protein
MDRHTADRESHLDAAERTGQHQVVEVAEVSDAEDAAFELAEPVPSDMSKRSRIVWRTRSASWAGGTTTAVSGC